MFDLGSAECSGSCVGWLPRATLLSSGTGHLRNWSPSHSPDTTPYSTNEEAYAPAQGVASFPPQHRQCSARQTNWYNNIGLSESKGSAHVTFVFARTWPQVFKSDNDSVTCLKTQPHIYAKFIDWISCKKVSAAFRRQSNRVKSWQWRQLCASLDALTPAPKT